MPQKLPTIKGYLEQVTPWEVFLERLLPMRAALVPKRQVRRYDVRGLATHGTHVIVHQAHAVFSPGYGEERTLRTVLSAYDFRNVRFLTECLLPENELSWCLKAT